MCNRSERLTLSLQTLFSALHVRQFQRPLAINMRSLRSTEASIKIDQLASIVTQHEASFGSETGWKFLEHCQDLRLGFADYRMGGHRGSVDKDHREVARFLQTTTKSLTRLNLQGWSIHHDSLLTTMHYIANEVYSPVLSSLRLVHMQLRYADLLHFIDKHQGTLTKLSLEGLVIDRNCWKELFNRMAEMRFIKLRSFRALSLREGEMDNQYGQLNPDYNIEFHMPDSPWIPNRTPLQINTIVENASEQFRAVATATTSRI